jgi:hypothetical protein
MTAMTPVKLINEMSILTNQLFHLQYHSSHTVGSFLIIKVRKNTLMTTISKVRLSIKVTVTKRTRTYLVLVTRDFFSFHR